MFGHIGGCIIDESDQRLGHLPSSRIIGIARSRWRDHDLDLRVLFEVNRFTRLEHAVFVKQPSPSSAVTLWPIRAFPGFSSFPHGFARKTIDSDPREHRILFAGLQEEVIQCLSSTFSRYEQFGRPPFHCLPAKLYFD